MESLEEVRKRNLLPGKEGTKPIKEAEEYVAGK
jgi:hypothetical protein